MDLQCKWCGETKPADEFVKRKASEPYSQANVRACCECNKAKNRERYKDPATRVKQLRANSRWRSDNREKMEGYTKRFYEKNPENAKARSRVNYLIRRGYWTKQPCVVCGHADYVEAHHDSYAKAHWETVRWLCKEHHESWHQLLDPVKNEVITDQLEKVNSYRKEAQEYFTQIYELRKKAKEASTKADKLEHETWNKVVQLAESMFDDFCK